MSELEKFYQDREEILRANATDHGFAERSQNWLLEAMSKKYVYQFDWLGRPVIQYPQDLQALQEIIWKTQPDVIVETGIAHGGSLIFNASMLALLDYMEAATSQRPLDPANPKRRVIGVDIDIREHNRILIDGHPLASAITMIEGSSIDENVVQRVKEMISPEKSIMICLDSNHTHDHVLAELDAYAPLVAVGGYCVVLDTFVEDAPTDFIPDRPWNKGNNPKTAVRAWMPTHPEFEVDHDIENKHMITGAPGGFLRRVSV